MNRRLELNMYIILSMSTTKLKVNNIAINKMDSKTYIGVPSSTFLLFFKFNFNLIEQIYS